LSLTSAVEETLPSSVGDTVDPLELGDGVVGRLVALISSSGEDVIGEAVPNNRLGIEEVGLTVPTPDCDGGRVVTIDDFVMQSSLLT